MITGIHAVPIYIESIDDEYKEKLRVLLKKINYGISDKWVETKCLTTATHGSTQGTTRDSDVIFNKYGTFIHDIIIDKAHKFLEQLGIKNLKLTLNECGVEKCIFCRELWCNKYTKGMNQANHNHISTGELFSFVYFAKYDPSKDAELVFVKDMSNAKQNGFLVEDSPYTLCEELENHPIFSNHVALDIKEGDLVIFPSYLDHQVEEQKTEGPRITIAGNLHKVIDEHSGMCSSSLEARIFSFRFLYKHFIKKRVTN